MSRSYKKTPYAGDKNDAYMKKQFNRKLRRQSKNIDPEGESDDSYLPNNTYKKANQSWEICDYYDIEPWEDYWGKAVSEWQSRKNRGYDEPYPDKEQEYKRWKKIYKQK